MWQNISYLIVSLFAVLFQALLQDFAKLVINTISLSRYEQVCLMRLHFERYFSHRQPDDGRSIFRNVASLNILVRDVINLLYYEH